VTPGATKVEQVTSNAQAADWRPTADDLAELEKVLGGS
jgi:aryl-alcohol dehydrogenase-like predicted oxidoreductase